MYRTHRSQIADHPRSSSNEQRMDSTSISPLAAGSKDFPAMSPTFNSADDAAYWAQLQIGSRRDLAHGAVIVQSANGKYRATRPVIGNRTLHFSFDDLLAKDPATGHFFVPEGYVGVAYFIAHAADRAEPRRLHPTWTEEQITLYLGFFFIGHLVSFLQDPGPYGQRHYLSGPDGSLIKYESTEPGRERQLLTSQSTTIGPFSDIERMIQRLAQIGTLSVLVANAAWGGRVGTVPGNWTPGQPAVNRTVHDDTMFYAPVADSSSQAILAASSVLALLPNTGYLGFVLRRINSRERLATYPMASTAATSEMFRVLRFDNVNTLKLAEPAGYELDGVYFISRADTPGSVEEPWLSQRFFTPDELAAGLQFAHENSHRRDYGDELRLYTATRDGAVLQYDPALDVAERTLRDNAGLNQQLRSGALKPSDYVRNVASHGQLSVIHGSPLWDVTGRVGADWQPYAAARKLSPVFVSADDAARFAHQAIGSLRDQAYVGLILQSADNGFVATLPVPAYGPRFTLDRLCPRDADGAPIVLHSTYALHGMYASRRHDGARMLSAEAAQMFTDGDIRALLDSRNSVIVAYLSGAADSLLAYRGDQQALAARARLRGRLTTTLTEPLTVTELTTELAGTGEVSVIVGSDTWGVRGTVLGGGAQKAAQAPLLGARFASAELAVLDARKRARGDYRAARCGLGFILKHKTREQYVATETVAANALDRLNHASDFGATVLIDQFRTHAVYYAASWLPRDLSTADGWFARHFIALNDLFAALYVDNGTQRLTHHQDLTLYIASLDGALLRYRFSSTSTLFDLAQGGTGTEDLLALMTRDTPPYRSVVNRIATGGELQVRITSECWDERGVVAAQWKPFALIQRRQLSPVFLWQDDAVRFAMTHIGPDRERVYGGLVLRRNDGRFVATLPVAVDVEDFAPGWIRLDQLVDQGVFLAGSTVVARYHSRRHVEPVFALTSEQRALYLNLFSTDFLSAILPNSINATHLSPGDEYLIGLDGSLIRYRLGNSALAQQLSASLAAPSLLQQRQTPLELQMRNGTLKPTDLVDRLAQAGQLQVVEGSAIWGSPRRVLQWSGVHTSAQSLLRFAVSEPALSPLFSQADDAARHVNGLAQARQQMMFGYLLKSLTDECYVLTLPVAGGEGSLTLERVFPEGLLPTGFAMHGVYLLAPTSSAASSMDVQRSFISAGDLTRALDAVRVSSAQATTYLGVYACCADGALLHYSADQTAAEWSSFPAIIAYDKQLQSGHESLLEFVRKLIKVGGLRVLERSRYWSPLRVDATGVKRGIGVVRWPKDKRLALGPLFAHADDAARAAQFKLGPFTDKQYLGAIVCKPDAQLWAAVQPLEDGLDSHAAARLFYSGPGGPIAPVSGPGAQPLSIPVLPSGFKLAAVHQFYKVTRVISPTNAQEQRLMDNLALADLRFSVEVLQKNALPGACCYLSNRGGALLKLTPNYTAEETRLLDEDMGADVSSFFQRLTRISKLEVLEVDAYWQRPGRVGSSQVPYSIEQAPLKHDEL
jgi:hypothetical protein